MTKLSLLLTAALMCVAASTNADVLANFTFSGQSRASFDADANTTATAFADGPGFIGFIDSVRGNGTPSIAIDSAQTNGSTQTAAVTAGDYFTFTLMPNSGATMSLTSLTFDYANYTNSGAFPTENFFVRSSIDNFAANLAGAVTATVDSAGTFTTATISLTGAAFQNLTGPVEFRIYVFDGTNDAAKGALLDNIVVNGTAIPEPGTYMLLGIGVLMCAQQFRRRNRRSH